MSERLKLVQAALQEHDLEALLITSPLNRRYVSGFTGSSGTLLVTQREALIFTDFRYRNQAAHQATNFVLHEVSSAEPLEPKLAAAARELGLHCVAFEYEALSLAEYERLAEAFKPFPIGLIGRSGMVEALRLVKDAAELATLRRAIAITDAALAAVLPALRPQMSERQAAWMLEVAMRERGADAISFPIIVGAGRNGANPHARASDALLGTGQPIVLDFGALLDGYHADLTRTVVLGQPDERFAQVYELVHTAQCRAIAGIRAGVSGKAVDALARDFLTEAGHGEHFGHGLGHGVGLNIHEGPRLNMRSEQPLQAGTITSVEPGVYLSEWGGVRIEDLVLVTEAGCELLSHAPYEPVVVL